MKLFAIFQVTFLSMASVKGFAFDPHTSAERPEEESLSTEAPDVKFFSKNSDTSSEQSFVKSVGFIGNKNFSQPWHIKAISLENQ